MAIEAATLPEHQSMPGSPGAPWRGGSPWVLAVMRRGVAASAAAKSVLASRALVDPHFDAVVGQPLDVLGAAGQLRGQVRGRASRAHRGGASPVVAARLAVAVPRLG
jgi:hypothetical protein